MFRLVFLVVLGLSGFYVAWPAWTGLQLRQAIETRDARLLESKVDFPAVRESQRPFVGAQIQNTSMLRSSRRAAAEPAASWAVCSPVT